MWGASVLSWRYPETDVFFSPSCPSAGAGSARHARHSGPKHELEPHAAERRSGLGPAARRRGSRACRPHPRPPRAAPRRPPSATSTRIYEATSAAVICALLPSPLSAVNALHWNVGLTRYFNDVSALPRRPRLLWHAVCGTNFSGFTTRHQRILGDGRTHLSLLSATEVFAGSKGDGRLCGGQFHRRHQRIRQHLSRRHRQLPLYPDSSTFGVSASVIGEYNISPTLGYGLRRSTSPPVTAPASEQPGLYRRAGLPFRQTIGDRGLCIGTARRHSATSVYFAPAAVPAAYSPAPIRWSDTYTLSPEHPAVVSWFDVEKVAGLHLEHASIGHGGDGAPGNHHPHVRHFAAGLAERRTDMSRPFPAGLIGCAPQRHAAEVHQL